MIERKPKRAGTRAIFERALWKRVKPTREESDKQGKRVSTYNFGEESGQVREISTIDNYGDSRTIVSRRRLSKNPRYKVGNIADVSRTIEGVMVRGNLAVEVKTGTNDVSSAYSAHVSADRVHRLAQAGYGSKLDVGSDVPVVILTDANVTVKGDITRSGIVDKGILTAMGAKHLDVDSFNQASRSQVVIGTHGIDLLDLGSNSDVYVDGKVKKLIGAGGHSTLTLRSGPEENHHTGGTMYGTKPEITVTESPLASVPKHRRP